MNTRTRILIVTVLLFGWMSPGPVSAQPETAPLVVMNLAAHPDDEDGSTLAYYRQGRDAIAYSVIFTRGEGGQNEIGPELYEELGAIRTEETLRASRHLGTQVHFLNFMDFGYSKSAEETFERWGGRDEVTSRVVYLIRKLKPDVLFTNHDTVTVGPDRQHGHHQVVGLSAYDAFELAADPDYHPEQFAEEGVDLWQPQRLFHRLWSSGDGAYDVAVPVGQIDETRGMSYAAMAAEGLYEHRSQGMEMFADRIAGWEATYFVQYRSATDARLSDHDLAANLAPNRSATPDLDYWIDSGRIPRLATGSVTVDDTLTVPGQSIRLHWNASGMPERPVRLRLFRAIDSTIVLRHDSPQSFRLAIDPAASPTKPAPIYQYVRESSGPPLGYVVYDAPTGELLAGGYVSMEVAPPLLLQAGTDVTRFESGRNELAYSLDVFDPSIDAVTVAVALSRNDDHHVLDQEQHRFKASLGPVRRTIRLDLPEDSDRGAYTVSLSALGRNGTTGPATTTDFVEAQVFDVNVPTALQVGVVESYDNTLAVALKELGVEYTLLDSTDLAEGRFEGLHTIVVDIRAYLVRQDLRTHNDRLLDWLRSGGHLIVNYQKTFEWNAEYPDPFDASVNNPGTFAPYPLVLGRDRVTRESAPVTLLTPDHALLTSPNAVEPGDWAGWVQERGLYFPESYDGRYTELFSLHDPGEDPLTSSTLLADVDRGTYLYTALVWYRQLKTYHPGAYKLFANMISLPFADDRAGRSQTLPSTTQ